MRSNRKRGLALAVLLIVCPAFTVAQPYEGSTLSEALSFDLDFSGSEHLLVRASQRRADYSLTLSEKGSKKTIRKVSFLSDKGLDELLLVSREECKQCVITLEGIAAIDRAGQYRVTVEHIQNRSYNTSTLTERVAILKHITSAAEFHFLADSQGADLRQQHLSKAYAALASAVAIGDNSTISVDDALRLHTLTFLAETQDFLGRAEDAKNTLKNLIAVTENGSSVYRALAYYEISAYEKNAQVLIANYDKGISIAKNLNDRRLEARGKNYKAIRLVRNGDTSGALNLLSEVYSIYAESQSWRDLVEPLYNLSWANQQADDIPASLSYATQLKLLAEEYQDEENALWALLNLGRSYSLMGDQFVASQFIDNALKRLEFATDRENTSWVSLKAQLLQQKAVGLLQYGSHELAADYAKQSRLVFQKRKHPNRVADVLFLEGEIDLARGNITAAQSNFERSLNYDRKNARAQFEAKCLMRMADLKIIERKFSTAISFNAEALSILSSSDEMWRISQAQTQKIELLHLAGNNVEAQQLIDLTSTSIKAHSRNRDKARFAYLQGAISYALGNLSVAADKLAIARQIIEKQLPRVRQYDLRQTYLALQKSIFELNIEVLLNSRPLQFDQSLQLAEAFKARTLAEKMVVLRSGENLSPDQAIQRKIIIKKILENAVTWYGNPEGSAPQVLSNTRNLSYELEKLEAEILDFRSTSEDQRTIENSVSIKVRDNELIGYYFTGSKESWLWVISSQSREVIRLPPEQTIRRLTNNVLQIFSEPPANRTNGAWEQNRALKEISDVILKPLKKQLLNGHIQHITIIADGPLHGLPFALLGLEDRVPLIANYTLSYAPSLNALYALQERARNRKNTSRKGALVVANPIGENKQAFALDQLPYSEDEAQVIQSLMGNSALVLKSEPALKSRLLGLLNKPYSLLHFATHGLLNDQEPALSGLVLSASSKSDGLWLTPEISSSTIDAQLVVLSACESSIGKHVVGEGLLSLSRAFIEAGASDVVGTLWQVQDQTSSILITQFYKYLLEEKLSIAQALQKAQAWVYSNNHNDWTDPYYWAGFQLQGGGENSLYGSTKET